MRAEAMLLSFSSIVLACGVSSVLCESSFKAYIINLASRPNRLENISKQLEKYDIPFEVFSAISPADIENERLLRLENKTSGRFDPDTKMIFSILPKRKDSIRDTEIGCTQSHMQILIKESKRNATEPFLILEDDAELGDDFYNKSMSLMGKIKSPWDILHVGYCWAGRQDCHPKGERGVDYCRISKKVIACTQGYFVNGSASAKNILKNINRPRVGIYDFILGFSTDQYFISLPRLIGINETFPSDNRPK